MTLLVVVRVLALSWLVAGCGGSSSGQATGPQPLANAGTRPLAGMLPVVDGSDVLAAVWTERDESFERQVPVLVVVDARGEYRAAAPPLHWPELGAYQLEATDPIKAGRMRAYILEGSGLGRPPRQVVADLAAPSELELDFGDPAFEPGATGLDDPPPPPEEDDSADETGATGTAMTLEEGRMGQKDSERTEGQYRMRKEQDDPQLAAMMAKERARAAAQKAKGLFRGPRAPSRDTAEPGRVSSSAGFIDPGEALPLQRAAIVAHPTAKAAAVVALLAAGLGDSLLVAHGKDVRPLRLLFGRAGEEPRHPSWIEVRAHQGAWIIDGLPGASRRAPVARANLAASYAALVAGGRLGKAAPVDVLVDDELTAQALIDVLVALDRAGARSISLGHLPAPGSPQATLRGSSPP